MKQSELTEKELVLELERAGFKKVSKRTIGVWRREALLPDFDIPGRGLGKGLGKTESIWKQPDLVIEQAKWIQRMKAVGIKHEDFHLYLWMLDVPIHHEDVRDSLLEPLTEYIKRLESEVKALQPRCERAEHLIEDVINEATSEALLNMEHSPIQSLNLSQEVLEAVLNVFLNPEYDLMDYDFAESFSAIEKLGKLASKFESEMFDEQGDKVESSTKHIQFLFDFLNNAEFVQENFSLQQLEKAIRECTHEELDEVQTDMRICVKIFMILAQTFKTILPKIKPLSDSLPLGDQFLPLLFNLGELIILADISLRRNGYSEMINLAREQLLEKIEKEFSETSRKEIEQAAPVIGQGLCQTFEIVERKFTEMAANSPRLQNATNN